MAKLKIVLVVDDKVMPVVAGFGKRGRRKP